MSEHELANRKQDHIELAFLAQALAHDRRFNYEPLFETFPEIGNIPPTPFAGKVLAAPLWISSMTGGTAQAGELNKILASVCREFGLGMGLGSCRPVLENQRFIADFQLRKFIGNQPLFANLGIAQIQELFSTNQHHKIADLVEMLEADGIIVHINPLQEWLQPGGDKYIDTPLNTISQLLEIYKGNVIVKEVGQGLGPKSLQALLKLPLEAIEFGAQGGTNFSLLESLRQNEDFKEQFEPVSHLGHTATEMVGYVNQNIEQQVSEIKTRGIIVSGGIQNFLDGYFHLQSLKTKAIYAQASAFLRAALKGEKAAMDFAESQIKGLSLAYTYLTLRKKNNE